MTPEQNSNLNLNYMSTSNQEQKKKAYTKVFALGVAESYEFEYQGNAIVFTPLGKNKDQDKDTFFIIHNGVTYYKEFEEDYELVLWCQFIEDFLFMKNFRDQFAVNSRIPPI